MKLVRRAGHYRGDPVLFNKKINIKMHKSEHEPIYNI